MPHHVAFIADPQLVDPHTYPGRPWPLSTLTVKYTDQYLRRSFSSMQRSLAPDSVFFLGDLFDGGREWATATTSSQEQRYKRYKNSFWRKEYRRFVKIFSDQWHEGDSGSAHPRGRRMIASLPGNHDLGFGSGIQMPVRERFQTFFGKGNRVDVVGNHTFVSVDTVSLSAMDQPDPATGSSGAGSGDGKQPNQEIWQEPEEFLNNMKLHKGKAEAEELRVLNGQGEGYSFDHKAVGALEPSVNGKPQPEDVGFPTVLLTHVPLYRQPATPCGPYREHYPPSSSDGELEHDEDNSIKISGGYQYQNVLTQAISNDLVSKVGPNLVHVYSGDDHDYCEILHREFSGSPREITVKSLSWAMGIRHPGFVLTSLWNPVDPETGKPIQTNSGPTVQNRLCLLPDQLAVFIYYGRILALTMAVLLIRSTIAIFYAPESTAGSVLPLSEHRSHPSQELPPHTKTPSSGSSSSSVPSPRGLAARAVNAPSRMSQSKSYPESYPLDGVDEDEFSRAKWKSDPFYRRRPKGTRQTVSFIVREFIQSAKFVAMVVLPYYLFLIWRW